MDTMNTNQWTLNKWDTSRHDVGHETAKAGFLIRPRRKSVFAES